MTIFTTNQQVDMNVLPEIALLTGGELKIDFAKDNFALGHIGGVSYLLSGNLDGEIINGVAVINGGGIAYQFRDMTLIPGEEIDSLDDVLNLILSDRDQVIGSNASDNLIGLGGSDLLDARRGDDVLNGGAGADRLKGGGGEDLFVFDILPTSGRRADAIRDFNPGHDVIGLEDAVFTGLGVGADLGENEFHIGRKAEDRSDRIIYDDGTGEVFYDSDGRGKSDQVKIAVLDSHLKLTHDDFAIL